jgi:tetratricopeptide (TPR) repeat protein
VRRKNNIKLIHYERLRETTMKNHNKEEIEEKKRKAEKFILEAETFIASGKFLAGFKFYQKATNIYFDLGSYMKIPDIFIRISTLLKKETNIFKSIEYLHKIRIRLKDRDLIEEEAKLVMIIGNLFYKLEDFASAAEYFEETADLYLKTEPNEYRIPSALFLIRSAECYENSRKYEVAERVVVQAVLRLNPDSMNFISEENEGIKLLSKNKFKSAIPIYIKLQTYFKDALEKDMSFILEDSTILEEIAIFAKTRLIQIISEYRLILMICYSRIGETEKSRQIAIESIEQLNTGINMLKNGMLTSHWNKEDVKRLAFSGFLRSYFQKFHHIKNETADQQIQHYLARGFTGKILDVLKNLPYYDLCAKTETYALTDLNELLTKENLGRLEKYKKIITKN